jgi:hypothetical protein
MDKSNSGWKSKGLVKNSKIDNDEWVIPFNRPWPFIFIGWKVLPCKERFTSRNQAKHLILLRLEVNRSTCPCGRLDRLAGFALGRPQDTPVRPPHRPVWQACLAWSNSCQFGVSTETYSMSYPFIDAFIPMSFAFRISFALSFLILRCVLKDFLFHS